jgi:hypothetical protein
MSEIAVYFKREKYITRRLSLVMLGGTVLLTPIALATGHGRMPTRTLGWAMIAYAAVVAFTVVVIVRAAYTKFPRSTDPGQLPLDLNTQRKLRHRIWFLEFLFAFYALGLLNLLFHLGKQPWLAALISAAINLCIETALIKAIWRLKKKLKTGVAALSPQRSSGSAAIL